MDAALYQTYHQLELDYQSEAGKRKKRLQLISTGRLLAFLLIFPTYYYLSRFHEVIGIVVTFLVLIIFLYLIKKFIQTEKELTFFQSLVLINQQEKGAIQRNFSSFDGGVEFIDPHHDYSFDLDLFGNESFFQFLNRTATNLGKTKLALFLTQTDRSVEEISKRQAIIGELAGELKWRQYFAAKGRETNQTRSDSDIENSFKKQINLKSAAMIRHLLVILPVFTLSIIFLNVLFPEMGSLYLIPIFAQWTFFLIYARTISRFHRQFENQSKILDRYAEMLRHIEQKSFTSQELINLANQLKHRTESAGKIIRKLQKILSEFDYRQNILVGFFLNSIFLWDLRCIYRLNLWQQEYADDLPKWFDVIAEFDAYASLANCNYNHPEWTRPTGEVEGPILETENIGHPQIGEDKCIRNNFRLSQNEQIALITGANMAGKSTFLRTIGINLILASNGCNVFATKFRFRPVKVFTNMRTTDNLMNDQSYFYAELLRLQTMLNHARNGQNLFVIIDEMLKGTNSIDKLNGSKELIRQLIRLNVHGLVATHDLGLTELTNEFSGLVKNQCFEVQLKNDELTFNYLLTDGVTRTMNASFLMKKMGIIPNDTNLS